MKHRFAGHTPGPLEAQKKIHEGGQSWHWEVWEVENPDFLQYGLADRIEKEEDAVLFAASPDLLTALVDLVTASECLDSCCIQDFHTALTAAKTVLMDNPEGEA